MIKVKNKVTIISVDELHEKIKSWNIKYDNVPILECWDIYTRKYPKGLSIDPTKGYFKNAVAIHWGITPSELNKHDIRDRVEMFATYMVDFYMNYLNIESSKKKSKR